MSRHEITSRDPKLKVVVGYDPPNDTFFSQVIVRNLEYVDDCDSKFRLWVGCSFREIATVDALAEQVKPFAELTGLVRAQLFADKQKADEQ